MKRKNTWLVSHKIMSGTSTFSDNLLHVHIIKIPRWKFVHLKLVNNFFRTKLFKCSIFWCLCSICWIPHQRFIGSTIIKSTSTWQNHFVKLGRVCSFPVSSFPYLGWENNAKTSQLKCTGNQLTGFCIIAGISQYPAWIWENAEKKTFVLKTALGSESKKWKIIPTIYHNLNICRNSVLDT